MTDERQLNVAINKEIDIQLEKFCSENNLRKKDVVAVALTKYLVVKESKR